MGMKPEPAVCSQIKLKQLSDALSRFEEGMRFFFKMIQTQNVVQAGVIRRIDTALDCYNELKKEAENKSKQTTLETFFQPRQSSKAASDDDSILNLSDYCSSSD